MAATEPPSARRLREARERGRVPRSGALAPFVLLTAAGGLLRARGEAAWDALGAWLRGQLERAVQPGAEVNAARLWDTLREPLTPWLWAALTALALAWLVDRAQIGLVWAHRAPPGPPTPPLRGFLSGFLGSAVVLGGFFLGVQQALALEWLAPAVGGGGLSGALGSFAVAVGLGGALVVAIDVARSRAAHFRSLRMHRYELERERRESEGPREPRRRQRRLLRAGGGLRA